MRVGNRNSLIGLVLNFGVWFCHAVQEYQGDWCSPSLGLLLRRVDTKVVARRSYEWGTINEVVHRFCVALLEEAIPLTKKSHPSEPRRGQEFCCYLLSLWRAAGGKNGLGSRTTCVLALDSSWRNLILDSRWLKLCKCEDWIAKMETVNGFCLKGNIFSFPGRIIRRDL